MRDSAGARLLTPRFMLVVACGFFYFVALAMLTPVLPHYVKDDLGYGDLAVGIAVGAFAVGSVVVRTTAGRLGDTIGRRVLIIGGALVVALSTACYGLVGDLRYLIAVRVVTGVGEAAFFVGAATMITDLAPIERRGEAVSYWSVAVYGGLSFGPALGDILRHHGYVLTFMVSAAFAALATVLAWFTVEVPREHDPAAKRPLVHPAAVRPGTVLFLGLIPLAAFSAFMPLYADDELHVSAGAIFLVYGILILVVRIAGARIPDRFGPRRTATLALTLSGLGVGIMAAWASVPGLVLGTIVLAGGMSLTYPALLLLAMTGVRDSERASVVGTFSSFFDLATGFGSFLAGAVVALSGNRGAFAAGTIAALAGLVVLESATRKR